jgi:hypothetical protein
MRPNLNVRIDESDLIALRERGINAGPYVRKLVKLLLAGSVLPTELQIEEDQTKWKLVRVKVRI